VEWDGAIAAFLARVEVYASPGTVRLRRHYLRTLAHDHLDPRGVTADDLVAFLGNPRWSPEARKSARSTLIGFYTWAQRTGRRADNPAADLPRIKVPPGMPRPTPQHAVELAMRHPDPRTRLMVGLAAYAGLRCAEIARLRAEDVACGRIRVFGKGRRPRSVPVHPRLLPLLEAAPPSGFLFPSGDGHLTPGHVSRLLSAALGPGWTGHTLRHAFATSALAATGDLRAVQILLGRASPTTTARYTQVADERLVDVVRAIA
jgi:integrase